MTKINASPAGSKGLDPVRNDAPDHLNIYSSYKISQSINTFSITSYINNLKILDHTKKFQA